MKSAPILAMPRVAQGPAIRTLALALVGALALMQGLLWAFLGLPATFWAPAGMGLLLVLAGLSRAPGWDEHRVGWPILGGALLFSAILLALGGEGRFFYANTDWQVRYAVLRDLTLQPWPFAYAGTPRALILRAPIGVYLLPALIGKATSPHGAELALWVQNSLLLTLVLGLGSALFAGRRARRIALAVVAGFSGMDAIGQVLVGRPLLLHMEQWAGPQFSSAVTQAFWVPQHGLCGWIFAVLYLLWRIGRVPAIATFAVLPLMALLSPLALMGSVPFAAHVLWTTLASRRLRPGDLVWPGLAGLIALPSLAYLLTGSGAVGGGVSNHILNIYGLFILIELGGYLFALWLAGKASCRFGGRFGPAAFAITVLFLLMAPFGQIGTAVDFVMRASIPALAILSVMVADLFIEPAPADARRVALCVFLVGLLTPTGEIARALVWPRSPAVECSYLGVVPGGFSTYVAPIANVPAALRPANPIMIVPHDPAQCWQGRWPDAATGRDSHIHDVA